MQRRTFLTASLAAGLVPAVITARDKSGAKNPIVGSGDYRYECIHNWGELPTGVKWQTTHGVCVDEAGHIYIKQAGQGPVGDTIKVFDDKGKFVRSFGKEFHGGGHGIDLRKEDGKEYLYLSDTAHGGVVVKADLKGEQVWTKKGPPEEAKYNPKMRYSPTNVAFAPDGGFYIGDGYGSNVIHQFDKSGKWIRSFGETGGGKGQMRTPHGIWVDDRPGREPSLVVADRANKRLQYFTLDGKHMSFVEGLLFPAHCETRGELLMVPDLHARVTLLGKDNKVVAQLGDDEAWRKKALDGFKMRQTPEKCEPGKFIHPHDACFDKSGNIYVVEWVATGRVTMLKKLS